VASINDATDSSGIKSSVTQPTVVCGTSGSISARVADCASKNLRTSQYLDPTCNQKYWWQLVTKTSDFKVIWRDNLTGLIWSDVVSTDENWCRASGSNNKQASPNAESDPDATCDKAPNQDNYAPVSLCAEDLVHLNGSTISPYAKGGLGKLQGATTPFTWWLPEIEELRTAYSHGSDWILPNASLTQRAWYWSATIDDLGMAWIFDGFPGIAFSSGRRNTYSVRCVGKE
jgi:hypothetical protein